MKSGQLSTSLHAYAQLLHQAGCIQGAHDLDNLATVFDRGGDQTVAATVKKIVKGRRLVGHVAEHPSLLKSLLEHIAAASKAAGATTAAKDYETVISLFTGKGSASARWFVDTAISSLEAAQAPPQPPPLDQRLIRDFAGRLAAASPDNAKFDAIVSELKAPRRFSNAILGAIANAYLGTEKGYKSKSEILKAITTHQLQEAIQGSRDRRIERIVG
jgi:hypothetical protein